MNRKIIPLRLNFFIFSDIERGFMIVNCLTGSNMTECDQLGDTLIAMAMNATDMLAEQCKIVLICSHLLKKNHLY